MTKKNFLYISVWMKVICVVISSGLLSSVLDVGECKLDFSCAKLCSLWFLLNMTFDSNFPTVMLGALRRRESRVAKFRSPLMFVLTQDEACSKRMGVGSQYLPPDNCDDSCRSTTSNNAAKTAFSG